MKFIATSLILVTIIGVIVNHEVEDAYKGEWMLEKIDLLESTRPAPFRREIELTLNRSSPSDNKMSVSFSVVNSFSGSLTFNDTADNEDGFDEVTMSPFASTRMAGPPEDMSFEREISQLIQTVSQMKRLDEDDTSSSGMLLMKSSDTELYFSKN